MSAAAVGGGKVEDEKVGKVRGSEERSRGRSEEKFWEGKGVKVKGSKG